MSISLAHPAMRTRAHRERLAAGATRERLLWLDPQQLRAYAVHDGGTGDEDPARAAVNAELRRSIAADGFRLDQPPLFVVDREAGLARLQDGTHRTTYAADAGVPLIPVRVRDDRINPRFPHYVYRGEFESASTVC